MVQSPEEILKEIRSGKLGSKVQTPEDILNEIRSGSKKSTTSSTPKITPTSTQSPEAILNEIRSGKNNVKTAKKSLWKSATDLLIGSEKNFAKDMGQAIYFKFGGNKAIEETSKKYLDSGNQLLNLAKREKNPERKKYLLGIAADSFKSAGATTDDIAGEIRSNSQIMGDAGGVLLDVLSMGTYSKAGIVGTKAVTSGLQRGVPTVVKGIVKEVTTKAGEAAVKRSGKEIAKTILKDSLLGSTYGLITTVQEKDATLKDYLTNAAAGAVVGAVLPPVIGGTTKLGIKGTKFVAGQAGKVIDKTAVELEKYATKEAPVIGGRFYEKVSAANKPLLEKAAEKTASGIRIAQAIPGKIATQMLDKYSSLGVFMAKAKRLGVETPDLVDMAQATRYRATGKAENKLDDYLVMQKKYGNEWASVKEYSHYLDDLDRLANDNVIAGNRTVDDVTADLIKLQESIPPEMLAKVKDGQRELQMFLNNELIDAVDSGRLSPEQFKLIKQAHPNYIPHDVLDFLDIDVSAGMGKTMNVSKSGIEKAVGSARQIDDIDNAVTRRLYRQSLLNEKNKTMKAIIDVGKEMGAEGGLRDLRTEEKVTRRIQILKEIKQTNQDLKPIFNDLKKNFASDKETLANIHALEKDLVEIAGMRDEEFNRFFNGDEIVPTLKPSRGFKTGVPVVDKLPQPLFKIAQDIKRGVKYNPFELEKLYNDGVLERNGFSSIENFVKYIKEPASITPAKVVQSLKQEDLSKLIALQTKLEKLVPKIERAKNIDKRGINDAFRYLEGTINELTQKKESLQAKLPEVADIKIKAVDIPEGFQKVSYFNNGVREDWIVPDDIGRAIKNLDGEQANAVMRWMDNSFLGKAITTPANILRKVSTTMNPVFALFRNPTRDAQTAILTATDDYSKGLIKTITGRNDEGLYRLARSEGAFQGSIYREMLTPEQILKQKAWENETGWVKKLTRPDKILEAWGQKMEEFTRIQVFSGALANGKTAQEAAKMARNATVDFGKSGNSLQVLNRVIPFLNARVQGFSNLGSAFVKDPTKASRVLMWTAAYPQAVLTAYNSRYESYDGILDSEKRKYWIVMVGEKKGKDIKGKTTMIPNYIKIPKGEAQQAVSNTVERVSTVGRQKYPESTKAFMGKLIGDISPVTDSSIWPAGAQQVVEVMTNHSFYRGKPIEGQWTYINGKAYETANIEPRYRTTVSTSEAAKMIGNVLNWSPAKIDYVIKIGIIGDVINALDIPITLKEKDKTGFEKASQIPIVSGVVGSTSYEQDQAKKKYEAEKTKQKNTVKIERALQKEKQKK